MLTLSFFLMHELVGTIWHFVRNLDIYVHLFPTYILPELSLSVYGVGGEMITMRFAKSIGRCFFYWLWITPGFPTGRTQILWSIKVCAICPAGGEDDLVNAPKTEIEESAQIDPFGIAETAVFLATLGPHAIVRQVVVDWLGGEW